MGVAALLLTGGASRRFGSSKADMLTVIVDVERQMEALKRRIEQAANQPRITEDEVDRLKYIEEELREILA